VKKQEQQALKPALEKEVMDRLYGAASSDGSRPGRHTTTKSYSTQPTIRHAMQVDRALDRARRKSFVRTIKPLRRLMRNQGAVNDSLIEAAFHLSARVNELGADLTNLQRRINELESQLRKG
jgi:hypothetical protein